MGENTPTQAQARRGPEASPPVSQRMLEEERNFMQQLRKELKKGRLRITVLGLAGVGKTTNMMTSESVMRGVCTFVPPHVAVEGHHGNRWLCQRSFRTSLMENPDEELTITFLDLKGIALDGTEKRSMDRIAEEARNIFSGIFPAHLLNIPDEARITQDVIEEHPQDALLLVFGADMLHVQNAEDCLATIANRLAQFHLPFFIVLTKIDLLPATRTVEDAIDRLVAVTGRHKAFIYPVANVTENRQLPSPETTYQIYRLFSGILYHSSHIRPFVPSFRRVALAKVDEMAENMKQRREYLAAMVQPDWNKILWVAVVLLSLTVAYLVRAQK